MDSKDNHEPWWLERAVDSAERLRQVLNDDLHGELKGVPFPIARAIHNSAIFELFSTVNRNHIPSEVQEAHHDQLVEFLAAEYEAFSAMCERFVQWAPRKKRRSVGHGNGVPPRKNPHLN